jgi:hypothetical protein
MSTPAVEISPGTPSYDASFDDDYGPRRRLAAAGLSPMPTYIGIAVAAAGFVLIAFAWGKVAGIADNVALQMPYLVSGGLTGLGLVMVGLTIVNVAAKRRDALLRQQQIELLADALRELRTALDDGGR